MLLFFEKAKGFYIERFYVNIHVAKFPWTRQTCLLILPTIMQETFVLFLFTILKFFISDICPLKEVCPQRGQALVSWCLYPHVKSPALQLLTLKTVQSQRLQATTKDLLHWICLLIKVKLCLFTVTTMNFYMKLCKILSMMWYGWTVSLM